MTILNDNPLSHGNQLSVQVFSNNLILQLIAKDLSVNDLKSFRLISVACYDASLSEWRKRAAVCLGPFRGWGRISVQEFMGHVEKSEDGCLIKSYQNFKLEFCSLPPTNISVEDIDNNLEFRFWRKFGPRMKHLQLKHCRFDQRKLVHVIFSLVRSLESLVVEGVQKNIRVGVQLETQQLRIQGNLKVLHVSGRLPFPNWQFLKYFPNLKEISLRKFSDDNLIQDLATLRREGHKEVLNLKCVDLIHTQQSLHGLAECHHSLHHLSFRLERDLQGDSLRDILHSQSTSLQTLKLFRFPLPHWQPMSPSPFQVNFSSLTELHLWGKVVCNFNFLKWMPFLKTLKVDLICHDKSFDIYDNSSLGADQPLDPYFGDMVSASNILLTTENFQHPSLVEFQMDYAFCMESLQILKKWMPDLNKFAGILNDSTLSLACSQWTKLKELKLMFGSDVYDEGITGVTLESVAGKEERRQNLTDLNELRSFEYECYCDTSPISDVSADLAFLRMPHLEHLRVCVSPQMTSVTETALKNSGIANVQILRNYGDDHSHLPINCCDRTAFYFSNNNYYLKR